MVRTVQQVLAAMPYLTIEWHHVRGHQDDPRDCTEPVILDIWAQWNILADIRAKHTRCHVQNIPVIPFMTGMPSVVLENIPSVTDSIESIRNHCLIPRAHEYWSQLRVTQGKESTAPVDTDWEGLGTAIKEMPAYCRRWVAKHSTGWCGVGRNLKKWASKEEKENTDDSCPRCLAPDERAEHVWVCQAPKTKALWEAKFAQLSTWMAQQQTAPELHEALKDGFTAWRAGQRRPMKSYQLRGLNVALVKQDRLGWKDAFEGRWAPDFADVQHAYFKALGIRRTGRRWLISLITKLWNIAWDLWEERNGIQAERREKSTREDALTRIREAYDIGPAGLHPGSRRLFTSVTLEVRLTHNTQSLVSWLLRIEQAQAAALLNPPKITQDQVRRARQERRRAATSQRAVQAERQGAFMKRWCHITT
jgi:hypothetical protein